MTESKKVVFITNRFGAKKLHDSQGLIGEFVDSKNDIIETEEGLKKNAKIENLWFLAFDAEADAEKIERVRKLKSFGTAIQETDSVPIIGQINTLRATSDPNKVSAEAVLKIAEEQQKKFDSERGQLAKDSKRYGQLFAQICKNGGGYIANADPTLIAEFEDLKNKLGINEEQDEEDNQ